MKKNGWLSVFAFCSVIGTPTYAENVDNLLVDAAAFQKDLQGIRTDLYTLRNRTGLSAQVTNYGAKLVTLIVPDRNGVPADIVMGYDNIDRYLTANPNFGSTVGRYANRISNASFTLDGATYTLTKNDGDNTLHGGNKSFRHVVWQATRIDDSTVAFTYYSKDGEEGYPGNLNVRVVYALTDNNELRIEYQATTDKPTVLNLTNHSFFNLAGHGNGDVLGQLLEVNASGYTRVKAGFIPTGEIVPVAGTPMDFRKPTPVGARIRDDYPELRMPATPGYDQNFVLDKKPGQLSFAARVTDPKSGRVMELFTTEPGLQVFSGQNSNGAGGFVGKRGVPYNVYSSLCLEPQHFPDSPNRPEFPSTVLRPGEWYSQTSAYRFSTTR
ncbi:aldose epimerase family protein [Propionivibrio soli]|uniref:aldose epimerase family protein n=1 Tax=Propionivibrio soli TaxID=2976531 RepID=UPI0021E9A1A5|nr:aldose epimerase family protein [Propionivibrio soli]